jgi:streptogramin lyase
VVYRRWPRRDRADYDNRKIHVAEEAGAIPSVGIVTGPDKNLWFTLQQEYGGIGRITTAGVVTLFDDPGGEYTQGITVGPDGALWFAESNGTVGRMTTKGKVTHFTVAASDAELEGIVTGPDGNLWVTQFIVGGSFTVDSGPKFICVGPDKALWFTEIGSNALGRLTTSGNYTAFPTGGKYVEPSGIATGPDGALWFTDFSSSEGIGRMTTQGKVQFYSVTGGANSSRSPQVRAATCGLRARWNRPQSAASQRGNRIARRHLAASADMEPAWSGQTVKWRCPGSAVVIRNIKASRSVDHGDR